jgi:hypothetical protein
MVVLKSRILKMRYDSGIYFIATLASTKSGTMASRVLAYGGGVSSTGAAVLYENEIREMVFCDPGGRPPGTTKTYQCPRRGETVEEYARRLKEAHGDWRIPWGGLSRNCRCRWKRIARRLQLKNGGAGGEGLKTKHEDKRTDEGKP